MMVPRRRVLTALLLASGLLFLVALPSVAIDSVRLQLGALEGEGWLAADVTVQFNWLDEQHAGLVLQAQSVALPEALGELSGVTLSCTRARYTVTEVNCAKGTLKAQSSVLGQQTIQTAFRYQFDSGQIDIKLSEVQVFDGTLAINVVLSDTHWQATVRGKGLSLPDVTRQLAAAGIAVPAIDGNGQLDVTASMNGVASQFSKADIEMRLRAEALSDADGSLAGENLDISLRATVKKIAAGMQVALELSGRQGALYIDPIFVEMPAQPLQLSARFDWLSTQQQVVLQSFSYRHPGTVQLEGNGHFDLAAESLIRELKLDIRQAKFPSLYDTYLQPWLYTLHWTRSICLSMTARAALSCMPSMASCAGPIAPRRYVPSLPGKVAVSSMSHWAAHAWCLIPATIMSVWSNRLLYRYWMVHWKSMISSWKLEQIQHCAGRSMACWSRCHCRS
jgi:hypothetical protein